MYAFDTLVEAINTLKKDGYELDYNLRSRGVYCQSIDRELSPEEFQIEQTFRFEGDSNPDDSSILYALAAKDGSLKGLLVDGYGVSSDSLSAEMIQKLR